MLQRINEKKRIYLSVSQGKLFAGSGEEKESYSFVDGFINSITDALSTFNGEQVRRWYINLEDDGEIYTICLPYSSGVYKSIILALASCTELTIRTRVKIKPYMGSNGYTKVTVYADRKRLDWITKNLPKARNIEVGGRMVKDDSEAMALIRSLTEQVQSRLKQAEAISDFGDMDKC